MSYSLKTGSFDGNFNATFYCQVPVASGSVGCYRICHCDGTAKLSDCINLECVRRKPCFIPGKRDYISKWKLLVTIGSTVQPFTLCTDNSLKLNTFCLIQIYSIKKRQLHEQDASQNASPF